MYIRQNVYELGSDWADPILWYARGVAEMRKLGLDKPTSWAFYGAIHGFDVDIWPQVGLPVSPLPSSDLQDTFWMQCQHQSWYFLPWHRGYLIAFEANVRAQIVKLGGPADWALPYWNYFKNQQGGKSPLPPAFGSPNWPDGTGNNPLFTPNRYGPHNDGNVYVPLSVINLKAMNDPDFTGVASGGSPGFGGVDTGFSHSGMVSGGIENQPHNAVHGLVGGQNNSTGLPGWMSDPDTAGYDPIFWLHHGNIDRLWEAWNRSQPGHVNPDHVADWANGPASQGERAFVMPMPDGSSWNYTPIQMSNLAHLGYTYDDFSTGIPPVSPANRLQTLGLALPTGAGIMGVAAVNKEPEVELVGASAPLALEGTQVQTAVQLDRTTNQKVIASLSADTPMALGAEPAPDRVFLNLENVKGNVDSTVFQVYVGLPTDADPGDFQDQLAGSVGLFGVRKASQADGEHGGQGQTYVLEITDIVDRLHLRQALDVDQLNVRLVAVNPVPKEANITIGRVSIYRQGQ